MVDFAPVGLVGGAVLSRVFVVLRLLFVLVCALLGFEFC